MTFNSSPNEPTMIHWGRELSVALKWMNRRAWALGGAVLFIATIYFHNYITVEKVSLNIASTATITALPIVFALVLFVLLLFTALLLFPMTMFFMPAAKGGKSIAAMLYSDKIRERRLWARTSCNWMVGMVLPGALLWLIIYASTGWEFARTWPWVGAAFWILVTAASVIWATARRPKFLRFRQSSAEYWFTSVGTALVQCSLLFCLMQITLTAAAAHVDSFVLFLPVYLVAVVVLGIAQIGGVLLIQVMQRSASPLVLAGSVAMAVITVLGLFPSASSTLVGHAIQATASGGRACSVFSFVSGTDARYTTLKDADRPGKSLALRVVFDGSDSYQVRPVGSLNKPTFFIQHADVASMEDCRAPAEQS